MADPWRGINQLNVTFSQGIDGLGSTSNNPLASRLDGRVDFTKVEVLASRTQPLFDPFSAFISGYGQYATTSLLTPEQCCFGGRFFGRAYDPSDLLGDSCYMGNCRAALRFRAVLADDPGPALRLRGRRRVFDRVPAVRLPVWVMRLPPAAACGSAGSPLNVDLTVAKAIDGPRDDTRFFFAVTAKY